MGGVPLFEPFNGFCYGFDCVMDFLRVHMAWRTHQGVSQMLPVNTCSDRALGRPRADRLSERCLTLMAAAH
jgi:hypothetical protein